jgi:hypothetical protein
MHSAPGYKVLLLNTASPVFQLDIQQIDMRTSIDRRPPLPAQHRRVPEELDSCQPRCCRRQPPGPGLPCQVAIKRAAVEQAGLGLRM